MLHWLQDLFNGPQTDKRDNELVDMLARRHPTRMFPADSNLEAYERQYPGMDVITIKDMTGFGHEVEIIIDRAGPETRIGIYRDRNHIWGSENAYAFVQLLDDGRIEALCDVCGALPTGA